MTERQEEQAALNALYALDGHERQILAAEMRTHPRLRELAAELDETAADVILLLPTEAPPEDVRARLLKAVSQRRRSSAGTGKLLAGIFRSPIVGWAAAACLAVLGWKNHSREISLQQSVADLTASESKFRDAATKAERTIAELNAKNAEASAQADRLATEVAGLKQINALSRMEVASLRATVQRFEGCTAVIVWDTDKQEGKIRLEKIPPVPANRDYQLWVIDKKTQSPVSAGVLKVDARGGVFAVFKPAEPMSSAARFAISIEALGGVPNKSADGPVIFAGPQ